MEGSEAGARRTAEALAHAARPALGPGVSLIGPAPAAIERIRGKSRWHLLLRGPDHRSLLPAHRALARVAARRRAAPRCASTWTRYSML